MTTEAFSVAIKLKLIDGVTTGLIGLTGMFTSLNKQIAGAQTGLTAMEKQLKSIKAMGVAGGALLGIGIGGMELLNAPVKAAMEYERAFTKFKALNLGDAVNKQADQFARAANLMGVSSTNLMRTMSESVGLLGGFDMAKQASPLIAQANAAISGLYGGRIEGIDEHSIKSVMQFIDRRGGTKDMASFKSNLDLVVRMITGSGGFIKPGDLGQFSQLGGVAFRGLSDQGIYNLAFPIAEQGGARAGQSMMSFYQNLVAGRTPVKTMHMLEAMNLGHIAQNSSGAVGGKRSTINTFVPNADVASLAQSDPVGFYRQIFLPHLKAMGITDEAGVLKATNDLFSNRNAAGQASLISTQMLQVMRDSKLTKNAMGSDDLIKAWQQSTPGRLDALRQQWDSLKVEVGEAALPILTKAAAALTKFVKNLTSAMHEFPGVAAGLTKAFLGLGALAAAGGSMLLITAGLRALTTVLTLGASQGIFAKLAQLTGALPAPAQAALPLGAGLAGFALGTWLNSRYHLDEKIGGFANTLLNGSYDPNGNMNITRVGRGSGNVTIHNKIEMDGRKVAQVVTKHQVNGLAGPQTGGTHFDGSMHPLPAGGL